MDIADVIQNPTFNLVDYNLFEDHDDETDDYFKVQPEYPREWVVN